MKIGTTMKPFNVSEISNRCQVVDHLAFNMDKIFKEESMTEILGTNSTTFTMEQRTIDWYLARKGVITGSGITRLITPTGKPSRSDTQSNYMNQLIKEKLQEESTFLNEAMNSYTSDAMQRGIDLEPEALEKYKLMSDNYVETVGFIKHNDYDIGCSPDGVGDDKGVEIKVPLLHNHVAYLRDNKCPDKYYGQVQMCMWLSGKKQWDFFSYSDEPNVKSLLITVPFDPDWVRKMQEIVIPVHDEIQALAKQFTIE